MYRCLIFFLFSLIASFSNAQNCLPSGIIFASQAEVDAFPSNYPNCTEIDGTVIIGSNLPCTFGTTSDINNLDSLNQIISINDDLSIGLNPDLVNLNGLDGLTNIDGDLIVFCNDNLASLNGLNNLTIVGGATSIGFNSAGYGGNAKLQNLTGLTSLTNPSLGISNNSSFKNFVGLNTINSLQSLTVHNCDSLENFIGLENITTVSSNVRIWLNNSNFNFIGLGNLTTIEGNFILDRNHNQTVDGLTSLSEIEGGLEIFNCALLNNLNGFSSLTTLEYLSIVADYSLTSLNGLNGLSNFYMPTGINNYIELIANTNLDDISSISSLDTIGLDDLQITNHPNLSECAIELVCDFINANAPNTFINSNMVGCNSIAEVETACSILPVIYSKELTARIENNKTILEFSVGQQVNNSHFEIQHSKNGERFNTIGEIEGAGTTTKEISYQYVHNSPIVRLNYYRIKQVDFDENFDYSNIANVSLKNDQEIEIYPNPIFNNTLTIYSKNLHQYDLISLNGEILLSGRLQEGENSILIPRLRKGIYIARFENSTSEKVIIY